MAVEVGADATVLDLKKQIGEAIDAEEKTSQIYTILTMHGYRSKLGPESGWFTQTTSNNQ